MFLFENIGGVIQRLSSIFYQAGVNLYKVIIFGDTLQGQVFP